MCDSERKRVSQLRCAMKCVVLPVFVLSLVQPVGHAVVPRRVHSFMSESGESPRHAVHAC